MKFRTEVFPSKANFNIDYTTPVFTIGSCFADNISSWLKRYRFNILANPFGVLYNPASIYNSLKLAEQKKHFTKDDLIYAHEEYHSFYHHSNFSHHEYTEVLNSINNGIETTNQFLSTTKTAIITFGTAYVYKFKETGNIVSNCHRVPQKEFERVRLSGEEAVNYMSATVDLLTLLSPGINIIVTVSPIRHLPDGVIENQRSKSVLHLAVDELCSMKQNVSYFPSYELMMDDLRDYRFYNPDLCHPSPEAIKYIWDKFTETFFTDETKSTIKELIKLLNGKNHRIRNANSESNKKFITNMKQQVNSFSSKYPTIEIDDLKEYFNSFDI